MAYFPFTPISYAAPERERFAYTPFQTPAPAFSAPVREDDMPAWAAALMQAGAGILGADPRKGWAGALGDGVSGGLRGLRDQKRLNDDAYDKKYRQEREKFGDERETWKLGRDDHNTGQRFEADSVRDENRYRSEDAGRQLETERFNSRGILDSKIAGDQSARGWANHGLSRERLNFDRAKDERDFTDRTRRDERDFGLRSNADQRAADQNRRAEEAAALARMQPEVKVNAWGEGVVIPRNEQGVFDIDKIRHIGNPNGGRAASTGAGAGAKVALDKVSEKDLVTMEANFADALGLADVDSSGYPVPTSSYRSAIPASVRGAFRDAAALEYARTGNVQAAVRAGMAATGIPAGAKMGGGLLGFGQSLQGPDGAPIDFGKLGVPAAPPAAPPRTQIVPRAPAPMPQGAPAPVRETPAAQGGQTTPPSTPSSAGLPPPEQRVVGQEYTAPNGRVARWTLNGWELVR